MQRNSQTPSPGRNDEVSLRLDIAQRSEVGKVRTENQDFSLVSGGPEGPGGGALMIVADGMGGHRGGATASRLAATTVQERFAAGSLENPGKALSAAIERANQAVFDHAQAQPDLRGMGTTVSVLYARANRAWFSHVGDSRIYRLRDGSLEQLTQDHSVVASMVREGLLTDEEAAVHPRRNVLQRSLGVAPDIEMDSGNDLELQPGDTYLLCSDGLHGFVRGESIREALELPPAEAVGRCIDLAYEAGAPDNVTAVVCRVETGPGERPRRRGLRWGWLLVGIGFAGALFWWWSRFGQGAGF
ncbi:MAG: Stp1/IreP family PP2C-type Ser/Thr phosphatase [Thermoanaerobaculia bacterium]